MTDNTQPEALRDARWYMVNRDGMATLCTDREDAEQEAKDANMAWPHTAPHRAVQLVEAGTAAAELHRQHARIAELEAQLSAIGAGGVSGPLMGQPQAMPDISALTERGAKAWAGVDAQALRAGGADMSKEREAFESWIKKDCGDLSTFGSGAHQHYRNSAVNNAWIAWQARASLAASSGSEPVATIKSWTNGSYWRNYKVEWHRNDLPEGAQLYTHPSPQEGMVGGWRPIGAAPKDGTRILLHPAVEVHDAWSKGHWSEQQECWLVGGSASGVTHTYWLPLPPSPSSADEGGGQSHPDSGRTTGGIVEMLQARVAELEAQLEAQQYLEYDERPTPPHTHPSPPEGTVGVWTALPGALPEPGVPVLLDIGKKYPIRALWAAKHTVEAADDDTDWAEYDEATETYYCPEGWYEWNEHEEIHWAVTETPRAWAPLPPTTPAGSGKGE